MLNGVESVGINEYALCAEESFRGVSIHAPSTASADLTADSAERFVVTPGSEAVPPLLSMHVGSKVDYCHGTAAELTMPTGNDQGNELPVQPRLSPGFCAGSAVFDPGKRNDGVTTRSCLADPPRAAPTDLVDSIGQSLMETDSISTDHAVDVNMLQPSAALHRPLTRQCRRELVVERLEALETRLSQSE